ncbi:IS5/IS1182 family transposase, partial [Xanthomonas fragariae]|nr:IS5/IS1182 family transposase [Xanthomonas fragariae]
KNTAHVLTLFALSNLWMVRRQVAAGQGIMLSGASQRRKKP